MEIFAVVLAGLNGGSLSADALIAAFERRLCRARLRACSSCAGDYEDPDRKAWTDDDCDTEVSDQPPLEDELPGPHQ